jgi:hypothetical protein
MLKLKKVIASGAADAALNNPVETKQDPAPTREVGTLQPATIKDVGGSGLSMAPTTPNLPAATSAQCGSETDDPADRGPEATFTQQSGGRRFSRTSNHHHPRHHHPRSLMMRNLLVLRTTTPIPAPLELHTTQGSARLPGAAWCPGLSSTPKSQSAFSAQLSSAPLNFTQAQVWRTHIILCSKLILQMGNLPRSRV